MRIIVTGGAGFIGSALIRHLLSLGGHEVINLDKLTYAADPAMAAVDDPRYTFEHCDIRECDVVAAAFDRHQPDAVMHLAAESHVDRSIDGPAVFLETNVIGTFAMLQAALDYWRGLEGGRRAAFRFHHISTDEVFGDLEPDEPAFTEQHPYAPSSPYSASKAASDHIVRAWHRTYGLPIVISNTSNNYGPRQFPEKLIPLMILNAVAGQPLPVYGDGLQIRDWIHVEDHAEALLRVVSSGRVGETYNIGGESERANIAVVETICDILQEIRPSESRYRDLVTRVADRPGHDRRYAIDNSKIARELDWRPRHSFESGLRQTIEWYLANPDWLESIKSRYDGERIGLAGTKVAA